MGPVVQPGTCGTLCETLSPEDVRRRRLALLREIAMATALEEISRASSGQWLGQRQRLRGRTEQGVLDRRPLNTPFWEPAFRSVLGLVVLAASRALLSG